MSKDNITARMISDVVSADQVSKKRDGSGDIIFRKGYFYRHGNTPEKFATHMIEQGKRGGFNIEVTDKGDHWASFNGGASIAKSSHFWVHATVTRI